MDATIEKPVKTVNVRLSVQDGTHARIRKISREKSAEAGSDVKILDVYLQVIELGLKQLESAA